MRSAFFGTPAIAVPALKALAEFTDLAGVVCQPDRPSGRGLKLKRPEVALAARALGVEIHQPEKVRTGSLHEWLSERGVDVVIVMAYGRILPPAVLAAPRLGCLNLHASLLPKYRGAAPIQWAIARGETHTGITLMQMDAGVDTGPTYVARSLEIGAAENAGSLSERLAELAAEVVRHDIPRVLSGALRASPQNEEQATLAPPISAADTWLDWRLEAEPLCRWIRALTPEPGAQTRLGGKRLKILSAEVRSHSDFGDSETSRGPPGTVAIRRGEVIVATSGSPLRLLVVQPEGRRQMSARDLANGRGIQDGDRFEPKPA